MKTIKLFILLLIVASLSLLITTCGSSETTESAPDYQNSGNAIVENPGQDIQAGLIRTTSGEPSGIRLIWSSSDETNISGYHLYKSSESITDAARGNSDYWVPVMLSATTGHFTTDTNGDVLIPQPSTASDIVVNDYFPVNIGENYYYRLTSVDSDGDESHLSGESAITITLFQVTELATVTAGVGDTVAINGERFGVYTDGTDVVAFPGVIWTDGVGFEPVNVNATILSWQPTQITVMVPPGATSGQVIIEVSGLQQATPETFTNSDPYITQLLPLSGTILDDVTINGANFGTTQDDNHSIVLGSLPIPTANYISYSDDEIRFNPRFPGSFGMIDLEVRVQDASSNTGRFNLTNINPVAVLSALPVTGNEPLDVSFDASASTDAEEQTLRYDYDWEGDGTYDVFNQASQIVHRYETGGQFVPAVRVSDAGGASDTSVVALSINQHPVANLSVSPNPALAPVDVVFDASSSTDPESSIASLVFNYNWGDGTPLSNDAGPTPPAHHYANPGDYQASVTVIDPQGLEDTTEVEVHIVSTVTAVDAGSPSESTFYQSDGTIDARYTIAGGLAPFTVTWTLEDDNGVLADTVIAEDTLETVGTFQHSFTIDTTTGIPAIDSDYIPLGLWHIRADLADATTVNDPDGNLTLPTSTGGYSVYRYNVLVIQDVQGDPIGVNAAAVHPLLVDMGYSTPAAPVLSDSITLGQMQNYHAVIWTANTPAGLGSPFEWLDTPDTGLLVTYLDNGGHAVVLGLPWIIVTPTPLFADSTFEAGYQPFVTVELDNFLSTGDLLYSVDFTANHTTLIDNITMVQEFGRTADTTLQPGAVMQIEDQRNAPNNLAVAALRRSPNAGGGNLYFGMFTMTNITGFDPSGVTAGQFLDNIVAGTITY